ncbi:hypothetical protein AAY473_032746, partial [Plecturocebus cupreus]
MGFHNGTQAGLETLSSSDSPPWPPKVLALQRKPAAISQGHSNNSMIQSLQGAIRPRKAEHLLQRTPNAECPKASVFMMSRQREINAGAKISFQRSKLPWMAPSSPSIQHSCPSQMFR